MNPSFIETPKARKTHKHIYNSILCAYMCKYKTLNII